MTAVMQGIIMAEDSPHIAMQCIATFECSLEYMLVLHSVEFGDFKAKNPYAPSNMNCLAQKR